MPRNKLKNDIGQFLRLVRKQGKRGCWIRRRGATWNGKGDAAYRVSYQIYVGEIPLGMCICHTCDNPLCVNPFHLFLGTQKDNLADMSFKNRRHNIHHYRKGCRCLMCKAAFFRWIDICNRYIKNKLYNQHI